MLSEPDADNLTTQGIDNLAPNTVIKGRSAARLAAVQALYQLEQEPVPPQEVIGQFLDQRFQEAVDGIRFHNPDKVLFQEIVLGVIERLEDINPMIESALADGWRLERIVSVVRAILRASVFELIRDTSVPTPVIINEYIEITKAFCSTPEVSFVNASLDSLAKLLRTTDMQE